MNDYEKKTSTVVKTENLGTWRDLYKHQISMENGDVGTYFSKSSEQNKFIKGEEVEYLWDGPKNRIKPYYEMANQTQQSKSVYQTTIDKEMFIIRQSSLKVAMEYINVKGGDIHEILDIADLFSDWVKTGEKPQKTQSNDLPF